MLDEWSSLATKFYAFNIIFEGNILLDFLFLAICLYAISSEKMSKRLSTFFYIAFSSFLVIFAFFRPYFVSPDDVEYINMYHQATGYDLEEILSDFRDPVYWAIIKIIDPIFGMDSLKALSGFAVFLKLCVLYFLVLDISIALFFYFCISYYLNDIVQIREGLAISIVFLSLYFLMRSKYLLANCFWLAPFVHLITILSLAFSVIKKMPMGKLFYFLPIIVIFVSKFVVIDLNFIGTYVGELYADKNFITRYVENDRYTDAMSSPYLLCVAILPLLHKRCINSIPSAIGFYSLYLSVGSYVIFAGTATFAQRLGEFFLTFYVLQIANLNNNSNIILRNLIVISISMFYLRYRHIGLIV